VARRAFGLAARQQAKAVAGAVWRHTVQTDDHPRQNPAYRATHPFLL